MVEINDSPNEIEKYLINRFLKIKTLLKNILIQDDICKIKLTLCVTCRTRLIQKKWHDILNMIDKILHQAWILYRIE